MTNPINKERLEDIRPQLEEESIDGLAKHNQAIGAIQLLNYLIGLLADDKQEDEIEETIDGATNIS